MVRRKGQRIVRWSWVALTLVLVVSGCAKKTPQQVIDVNQALAKAKDDCATVYAADGLGGLQGRVDEMNNYVDQKKMKKARKSAVPLLPEVQQLGQQAQASREQAKADAEAALKSAEAALEQARQAETARYNATGFGQAETKLAEAAGAMKDPCRYASAKTLADDAARQAGQAREAALAEKRRQEEQARLAEEERRRKEEEEARRLAEEQRQRDAKPGTYVVQRGDYLWRIAAMDKIYHKPIYWPLIADANSGQIKNPDLIYPGQEFTIPRELSDSQMMDKLYRLWSKY